VRFVQAGGMSDGSEIAFVFSNLDRTATCSDTPMEPRPAGAGPGPSMDTTRLAWVIANSRYGNDWPQLPFVETDRDRMTTTLRRCGYDVMVSSNLPLAALSADAATFRTMLARRKPGLAIVYLSGHGMAVSGTNYLVPADAPASAAARETDLFSISDIVRSLHAIPAEGGLAVVLVDACRATRGDRATSLVPEAPDRVLVNHSASPGNASFDGERDMSAWTERFIAIADAFPDAGFDQVLGYANRYTKWQSEASLRVQVPILYGIRPDACPAFGIRRGAPPPGVLPHVSA
jgi:hypothetical protein